MEFINEFIIASQILADSSSEGLGGISALLLLTGPGFFALIWFNMRNTHKRHSHEKETSAELRNLATRDQKIGRVTGVSNSEIRGANNTMVRGKTLAAANGARGQANIHSVPPPPQQGGFPPAGQGTAPQ